MTYIGSGIVTQPFLNDVFSGNGTTAAFSLSIAPANVNAIIVAIGTNFIAPNQYSLSGSTLTFSAPPVVGTNNINVRHLGVPTIPFFVANASVGIPQLSATGTPNNTTFLRGDNTWALSVPNASVGIPQLSATGTPSSLSFLRGDNTWALVTGTVSNVSFASPANFAFSVATPSTTPVISLANVGGTPGTVFLRGDGLWVAPSSITNLGGWAVAQSGTKLAFTYNGALVVSISSNGDITSAQNLTAFGTP